MVAIVIIGVTIFLIVNIFKELTIEPSPIDTRIIVQAEVEQILQPAKGPIAGTYTNPAIGPFGFACENSLPEVMKRNKNRYTITVVKMWNDKGPFATEVLVDILFPDGAHVEMQYDVYTLKSCRVLSRQTGFPVRQ